MKYDLTRKGRCKKHGETEFMCTGMDKRRGVHVFVCSTCYRAKYKERPTGRDEGKVRQYRKDYHSKRMAIRSEIVSLFGGECVKCGYDKSIAALHFHHRESEEKRFQIASREMWRPMDQLVAEAEKCDLICANCHYELHYEEGSMGPRSRLNASV